MILDKGKIYKVKEENIFYLFQIEFAITENEYKAKSAISVSSIEDDVTIIALPLANDIVISEFNNEVVEATRDEIKIYYNFIDASESLLTLI